MTRCLAEHPLPFGKTECQEHANSLVRQNGVDVPVCPDWALELGVQGARLTQLTPETARAALGSLFSSTLPTDDDEDDCGMALGD